MAETRDEADRAELRITGEEARHVADLLRYVISLNTTVGLVSPTQRRLATSTYKAVELAALILEGKTFDEAVEESDKKWTGSLEEDHRRALELLQKNRETLREAMSDRLTPNARRIPRSPGKPVPGDDQAENHEGRAGPKRQAVNTLTGKSSTSVCRPPRPRYNNFMCRTHIAKKDRGRRDG